MAGKKHRRPEERVNYFKAAMFFITLGIMPLIVHYIDMTPSPEELFIMPGSTSNEDMFSYYKSWLFAVCTIVLGLNSLWDFLSANEKFDYKRCLKNPFTLGFAAFLGAVLAIGLFRNLSGSGETPSDQTVFFLFTTLVYTAIFFPQILISSFKEPFQTHIPKPVAVATVVFLMCVFATTAFTDYRHLTYHGAIERCESVFALLGYIVIMVEVANFATGKRGSRAVFAALAFSATAIGVIGFFQLLGMDFFNTDIANRLVLGEARVAAEMRLSPRFREVYATLYNPNSVGIYSAMMVPFSLAAAFLWPKKSPMKIILFAIAVFGTVCLFGSNSSAGLIGCIAALASFAALMLAHFLRNKRGLMLFGGIAAAGALVVTALLFIPATSERIMLMIEKFAVLPQTDSEKGYMTDIEIEGDTLRMIRGANSLTLTTSEAGALVVTGPDGTVLTADSIESVGEDGVGGLARYSCPGWRDFTISVRQSTVSYREPGGMFRLFFGVDGNRDIYPLAQDGSVVNLSDVPPSIGFENAQLFASSRGYIWSKSLPIALKHLLIGTGVDSFVIAFPQKDLLARARFFDNPYIIIDKAHNMYLQTAVNTGFVSSVAQIALFAIFLFWAFRKIIFTPKIGSAYYATLVGAAAGVIGYMVTGLSTDSVVSVAPIFWAVLGLGYACVYALDHGLE